MSNAHPLILALDWKGIPNRWIHWQTACYYYAKDLVAWSLYDDKPITIYGGVSKFTGTQSKLHLSPIIAVKNQFKSCQKDSHYPKPRLTNKALFSRDRNLCAYCGKTYAESLLTRDHIIAISNGGKDNWTNCVTACVYCNNFKGSYSLDECGFQLLYVPYVPSRIEHLILCNKKILSDQMQFLQSSLPKESRLLDKDRIDKRYNQGK